MSWAQLDLIMGLDLFQQLYWWAIFKIHEIMGLNKFAHLSHFFIVLQKKKLKIQTTLFYWDNELNSITINIYWYRMFFFIICLEFPEKEWAAVVFFFKKEKLENIIATIIWYKRKYCHSKKKKNVNIVICF